MRVSRNQLIFALCLWLGGSCVTGWAQPEPPEAVSPQLQLMLSQPAVDLTTPVTATAVFDPPVVRVGEKAVYRATFNALEASLRWPGQFPAPAGLEMTPGARGQALPMITNIYRPLTSVNFHARAGRPGFFTVPAYWVEVYGKPVLVPEARLEVAEEVAAAHEPARELILRPARTNLFVGETMRVRVLAPGSLANGVETLGAVQFNGDGCFVDKSSLRQTIERLEINGRNLPTFVSEINVTPIAAGAVPLTVQAFTTGSRFSGPVGAPTPTPGPGGAAAAVLLDSDPVVLQVRPLPGPAAPGFTGFIGNLAVDPPRASTNTARVGAPLKLYVTLRGDGPLARLVPPPPPVVAGWQVFPATPAEPLAATPPAMPPMIHTATFAYTLIPLTEEARATPAIPFSYFDPRRATYLDLTIPGAALTISAEGLPTEAKVTLGPAANETAPAPPAALCPLARSPGKTWSSLVPLQMQPRFLLAQLIPAFALGALWTWDRRRRYLAAQPEIVRRRQARRALRRERRGLARAAANGDAAGFIRSGVAALQIAAAPHFSAAPRAVVCGEVLSLLSAEERGGRTGEVVREIFARHGALNFGLGDETGAGPLALGLELEGILEQMEARL